jgi:crotonobetainyl-CoA:carnitine CoA-transferase CaiB-like acyl-CoA transferase
MIASVDTYRGTGIPARFSRTPGSIRRPPPRFGEDSVELLEQVGLDDVSISKLLEQSIVQQRRPE